MLFAVGSGNLLDLNIEDVYIHLVCHRLGDHAGFAITVSVDLEVVVLIVLTLYLHAIGAGT